jgi:hypothetical protein
MKRCLGLLGLALTVTACGGAHSAARPPSRATAGRVAPPATQWVDTHGVAVAVPARWRLNRGMCGTPKANTVLWNEDGVLACATRQPPGLSVVEFGWIVKRPPGWYGRHTTTVTIDGALARRWIAGTVDGSHEVQLVFPRRGISVTVLSPNRSLLRRILASIRTVRVDETGCPTRPTGVYRDGLRPNASQPFVPRGAARAILCSYKGVWLDRSKRIGRRAAAGLGQAFTAAPSGFSHAHPGSILPSSCIPSWRDSLVVARFEYLGGRPPVSVSAHLMGCSRLGASNGRWAIRLRPAWVDRLVRDAHYLGDFLQYAE